MPEFVDHNIIFQQKPVDLLGGIERGQKIGFDYQNNPIQIEQAKTNLAFDQAANPIKLQQGQANLQTTLTQNESDKIKLEQERQQNEFLRYLDTNRPGLQPDGTIDKNQALVDMAKAGHSRNALGYIDQVYKTQAAGIKNDQDLYTLQMGALKDASNVVSSMPTNTPQDRAAKAEAVQRLEVYTKKQTGKSATEILGPNWHSSARNINIGPVEATNLEVTQRNNNIDADAKDPNSPLNRAQNEFNDRYAPGVATSRRLSDSSRMPEQQASIQSQMISGQTRAESAQVSTKAGAEIQTLTDLQMRLNAAMQGQWIKPGEAVVQALKRLGNSPQAAELASLVEDLKPYNINLDTITNPQGVLNSLEQRKRALEVQRRQAESATRARSYSETPAAGKAVSQGQGQGQGQPAESQKEDTSPVRAYVGTNLKTGKPQRFRLSDEQAASPEGVDLLRATKARRVP